MTDEPTNFKALAEEAAKGVYNPRARRCWPWSHEWTMWETDANGMAQTRRCVGCGKLQRHVLAKQCEHQWHVTQEGSLVMKGYDHPIGHYYNQRCLKCGDVRRRDVVN